MPRLTVVLILIIVAITIVLGVGELRLNSKLNSVSLEIKNVNQEITCGEQEVNPPGTPIGTTSCIGLKTQLDELLDK